MEKQKEAREREVSSLAAARAAPRPFEGVESVHAIESRYDVVRKLGSAASQHAWEARERASGAHVTLKVLPYAEVGEPRTLELFERQFDILRSLSHRRIPRAHELLRATFMGQAALVIVLDHVAGESLEARLEQGLRFDEARARALLQDMLEILEHLHSRSPAVVHRDIKPSNIVLHPDGAPVLVDFDTARQVSSDLDVGFETFVATAGYVPPEQVGGRSQPASDLYALGATLVAALSRRHPTELPVEAMRLRFEPYVNVSPGFAGVLRGLLEPDVDERFRSVAQVREALAGRAGASGAKAAPKQAQPESVREASAARSLPLQRWALALLPLAIVGLLWARFGAPTPPVPLRELASVAARRDAVAMGPIDAVLTEARSWSPTREELAKAEVLWAASVVDASLPNQAQLALGAPDFYRVPNLSLGDDASRAWHPGSGEQWLTLAFPEPAAAKTKSVLIVEASGAGGVARIDDMSAPEKPVALWRGRLADSAQSSRILRVDLPSARKITRLRVFLDVPRFASNPIDAVGLLIAEPAAPAAEVGPGSAGEWSGGQGEIAPPGTAWAATLLGRSLEHQDARADEILGAPDAFPRHSTSPNAWVPSQFPFGRRWIAVGFGERAREANGLLVYESKHPGAIVRIDDLSGREHAAHDLSSPVVLWAGRLPLLGQDGKPLPYPCWGERARAMRIDFPAPRAVSAIRLVLDTSEGCYSEIDAVGLLPLPGGP